MFAAAVTIAEQYGAVVRALGDDQQLSAVGSGGALRYLKNTVGAVHLEDLHRFRNPTAHPTTPKPTPPWRCANHPPPGKMTRGSSTGRTAVLWAGTPKP
jgi:hypothetical protein